jgi:predicted DNA-binding transcriptional regulator AlpA
MNASPPRIVRRNRLAAMLGISLSTLARMVKNQTFPAPIRLSAQAVGWDMSEVESWLESRRAAKR